jgi:hypothetical protein
MGNDDYLPHATNFPPDAPERHRPCDKLTQSSVIFPAAHMLAHASRPGGSASSYFKIAYFASMAAVGSLPCRCIAFDRIRVGRLVAVPLRMAPDDAVQVELTQRLDIEAYYPDRRRLSLYFPEFLFSASL